jgi:hypothetical protein
MGSEEADPPVQFLSGSGALISVRRGMGTLEQQRPTVASAMTWGLLLIEREERPFIDRFEPHRGT